MLPVPVECGGAAIANDKQAGTGRELPGTTTGGAAVDDVAVNAVSPPAHS